MEKRKFYVNIGDLEISEAKVGNNDSFVIYANAEEIIKLRDCFDTTFADDRDTFFRAHIPLMEYHDDDSNDRYDQDVVNAYHMIYDLGDEQAKAHIESLPFFNPKYKNK